MGTESRDVVSRCAESATGTRASKAKTEFDIVMGRTNSARPGRVQAHRQPFPNRFTVRRDKSRERRHLRVVAPPCFEHEMVRAWQNPQRVVPIAGDLERRVPRRLVL